MKTVKIGGYNNKGGVGKTTFIINVSYFLSKSGKKVLVVDCDDQMNCYDFLTRGGAKDQIQNSRYERIDVGLWQTYAKTNEGASLEYDYILFDLPPAMNDGVKEIIRHCDKVFVPVFIGYFEISGLQKVTEEVSKLGNFGGVFVSKYDKNEDANDFKELKSIMRNRLLNTVISRSKTVSESQKKEMMIEEYFIHRRVPKSSWNVVRQYVSLTEEILERAI
jgi:chromosome partitioning protein